MLILKKEFDSEPVCHKHYLITQIKPHGDEVTNFYNKKIPKLNPTHICLAGIRLDSALKKGYKYYLQVFLKEHKYTENKVIRHINDNLSDFSYSSDESDEK